MAVAPFQFPDMRTVSGITLGTSCAGIKQTERDDILVIEMAENSNCAGVFTRNAFCAAPVQIAKQNLAHSPRWLLINSGNANAGTGVLGLDDSFACCEALAAVTGGSSRQVLPFSTGVIGERLPVAKITQSLQQAMDNQSTEHWSEAAKAIMTTDTFAKGASVDFKLAGKTVSITGISKGAGMIQPNMATMLAFITTDANISQATLQLSLQLLVEDSFNRITVDGDTSTNDACILIATGHSGVSEIVPNSEDYKILMQHMHGIFQKLAEAIVRDGEGATKLMRIIVQQAVDADEALLVAKTIAHSPLVKTAFFASDPNWGRILAAVGRSGVKDMKIEDIKIHLDDVCIVSQGGKDSEYTEQAGQQVMLQDEIKIIVSLARGDAKEQVLTCDLSYDYVRINAEYRT